MYWGGGCRSVPLNPKLWLMADYLGLLHSVDYQADRTIDCDCHGQMEGRMNWLGL